MVRKEQNLDFSVLTIDQKLHLIQPFTADHSALLKSVDRSSMWSFIQYQNQSTEIKAELQQILSQGEPQLPGAAGNSSPGGPSPSQIQSVVNWRMAKIQYDMLQAADAADRAYNARATIDALLALVRAQAELPGRKVILYFNPWMFIPEVVKEQYANLISTANRANVSFYTVDPKGLVTWDQEGAGRDYLSGAAGETRSQQMRGGTGDVTTMQRPATGKAEGALPAHSPLLPRGPAPPAGGATSDE